MSLNPMLLLHDALNLHSNQFNFNQKQTKTKKQINNIYHRPFYILIPIVIHITIHEHRLIYLYENKYGHKWAF